jgi:hypothetical protein
MEVIAIEANRLDHHAGHTSQQLRHASPDVGRYTRIQDPAAVVADPHHVVLEVVSTVGRPDDFHAGILPPPGSFIHG